MNRKTLHGRDRLQHKVGSLIRKATISTGEMIMPRDLLGIAFSNVGKVRRDVLDILFQEIGRHVENFADNYTIKIRAELNFERKKDKPKKNN